MSFHKRMPPVGSRPGTLVIPEGSPPPRIHVFDYGEDFCEEVGAPNILLLSRPDGLLEDATANILAPPCDQAEPLFEGQHLCYHGGVYGGRTAGIRYPGPGTPVAPDPSFTHSVATGDIDGDGDVDILIGNVSAHGIEAPYFLINDSNGNFMANWQWLPEFLAMPSDEGGSNAQHYLLADMDGDNKIDLVSAPFVIGGPFDPFQEYSGGISWNDGSGDFSAAPQTIIQPPNGLPVLDSGHFLSASRTVAVDIDNDGDLDLVIAWIPKALGEFNSAYQIMINKGGRVFADETEARFGKAVQTDTHTNWTNLLLVEDINGDNCPDIVYPDNFYGELPSGSTGIWLNNCQGYFSLITEFVRPKDKTFGIPLDYDGDGDLDILSWQPATINLATNTECAEGEGSLFDYIDFAVWINVNAGNFRSTLISRDGFEE